MPLLNGQKISRLAYMMGVARHSNVLSEADVNIIATAMGILHNTFDPGMKYNPTCSAIRKAYESAGHTEQEFRDLTTPSS